MTIISSKLLLNSILHIARLWLSGYHKRLVTSSPILKLILRED